MKRIYFIFITLCALCEIDAQDVIVKKDGSTILSKVLKLSDTEIEYKKWSNQSGPTYVIKTDLVLSINYQNGEKEVFSTKEANNQNETTSKKSSKSSTQATINYIDNDVIDLSGKSKNNSSNNNAVEVPNPYNNVYGVNSTANAINQMQNSNYEIEIERLNRKAKSWNTAGLIILIGGGVGGGILVGCVAGDTAGYVTMGGCFVTGIYCTFKSGSLKRSATALEQKMRRNNIIISDIYNYEKTLKNGQHLKGSLSLLGNQEKHDKAFGFNLCYTF